MVELKQLTSTQEKSGFRTLFCITSKEVITNSQPIYKTQQQFAGIKLINIYDPILRPLICRAGLEQ